MNKVSTQVKGSPQNKKLEFAKLVVSVAIIDTLALVLLEIDEKFLTILLVVLNVMAFYLGSLEISESDAVLFKDPPKFGIFQKHPLVKWFVNGLLLLSLLFEGIGFLSGFTMILLLGFLLDLVGIPLLLLVRYFSYSLYVFKESGGLKPKRSLKHLINCMVLCLPLLALFFSSSFVLLPLLLS